MALAALVAAVAAAMALTSQRGLDYSNPPPGCAFTWKTCDDPAPALGALADLHLGDFFHQQPFMGPLTLIARAPAVAIAEGAGAGVTGQYRWGALVCLLVLGAYAVFVALRRGPPLWLQLVIAVGAVANPITTATLDWGHPEEVVAGALTACALICAIDRRPRGAGVLLGLAIAAKAWAVLAFPALLLVLPLKLRRDASLATVIMGALLIVPMLLGDPHRFGEVVTEVGKLGSQLGTLTPTNLLWPLGDVHSVGSGQAAQLPTAVARGARVLVFASALAFTAVWWRRGGRERPESVLLLVALILFVRGLLDPSNHSYYHAGPFLLLLAYESVVRRPFPWASAAFLALFEATNRLAPHLGGFDGVNRLYLAWAIPFAIYLAIDLLSGHGTRAPVHRETRLSAGPAGV